MTRRLFGALTLAALMLVPAQPLAAQQSSPWVHIEIVEQGDKAKNVKVNLPLSVVEVAMEVAPQDVIEKGHLKLKNTEVSVADLRRLWQELRSTGDAEFVSVEEKDQTVRIAREGDYIHIRIHKLESEEPKVRVEVPVTVVDALLEGEGSELNLRAAIAKLRAERGDLVQIHDGDTHVRVWIDERI